MAPSIVRLALAAPFLVFASAVHADCSKSVLGGDPFGLLTKAMAFTAVNANPPAAMFLMSDVSQKGAMLPTGPGPTMLTGTPFSDYIIAPNASSAAGLNAGSDVFLLADRQQERPGLNEVDIMEAGNEANGGALASLFILGDTAKKYYAGKRSVNDPDHDYAYINRFVPGHSRIRLSGGPDDYRLTWISGLFAKSVAGTAIVTQRTCDVVGFVRNVLLTDLNGEDFEYARRPSPTPAVSTASQPIRGIDQIGGAGDVVVAGRGPATATDPLGNLYVVFGSSSSVVHGVGGVGSFYLVKYDAAGNRLWTRKHGVSSGYDAGSGIQVPGSILVRDGYIYVAGMTYGPYGGPKPSKVFTGADGITSFVAKFDDDGKLVKVAQFRPTPGTQLNPAWAMTMDNAGDLYLGGSTNEGLSLPFTSPYVMKVNGANLTVDTRFGTNGSIVFRNGPVTVLESPHLLASALDNLQLFNFTIGIQFVPDGSGRPGSGAIYVAGGSDNGSFFGSEPGWNNIWYTKLDAPTGRNLWLGTHACDLRGRCGYTGGYSLSAPDADSYLWAIDVDDEGNLYLAGETGGTFSRVGHMEAAIGAMGKQKGKGDGIVVKIDPAGTLLWRQHLGTWGPDSVRDLRASGSGLYVLGQTRSTVAGTKAGRGDIFAARLDKSTGQIVSKLQFGSARLDVPSSLSLSDAALYLSGVSEGSVARPSGGSFELFLVGVPRSSF